MSGAKMSRGLLVASLITAAMVLVGCTPPSDGGDSTTTPTITGAEYAQSGVKLSFTPPTIHAGTVVNYLYDVSCDGGLSVHASGQVLGTVASPAEAFATCGDGVVPSYRLSAVLSDSSTSPPSPWQAPDALSAPSLDDAQYTAASVTLHYTAPTVAVDQSISSYVYDLSCDGGASVQLAAQYVSPATNLVPAGNTCPDGTPSSYRLAAVIDGTWTSPYSSWRAADALVAPTLTVAMTQPVGAMLTFTAPAVGSDETITSYLYDLSCDGGHTTLYTGQYIFSGSPATVGYRCASPAISSYRIAATISGSWTSPYTGWRAAT